MRRINWEVSKWQLQEEKERYYAFELFCNFQVSLAFSPENNLKGEPNQEPRLRIKCHTDLMPVRRVATVWIICKLEEIYLCLFLGTL